MQDVEAACERSDAVASYRDTDGGIEITWIDGTSETLADPQAALATIAAMSTE